MRPTSTSAPAPTTSATSGTTPAGPPTRGNEIWLDLDANAAGQASDEVVVSTFDLTQALSLVIHQHSNTDVGVGPPGPRTACGDVVLTH